MSKIMTWCSGLALACVVAGCGPSSVAAAWAWAAGPWGRAIEVPGLGALNKGADAIDVSGVSSFSCASAGNCAAGGDYRDRHHHNQGFVSTQKNGVWGGAIEVPGLGALNKGGGAHLGSVSCGSAGNCAAGGSYQDQSRNYQGFVVVERNGRWGRAIAVPGLRALNKGGGAFVSSVSCGSAGNWAAGGAYEDQSRQEQGFVVVERNGRWGRAIEVPVLGPVISLSCPSAGNCAGVGYGSVVSLRHGRLGKAIELHGLLALNKSGDAQIDSLSCASAGNCAVGGDYTDGGHGQGFVAAERNGRWSKAIEVPGLGALNKGGNAHLSSVSCASAGNCAAAGTYGQPYGLGFVAVEKNGVWGKATSVPGLAALTGRLAEATSVSCASPGNCAAVGDYSNTSGGRTQGFVAVERHGRWGKAIEVPGLGALNKGGGVYFNSVSCAPAGTCSAGGSYTDRHHHFQGFVVSQTPSG
jgi:hypothetical protein